MEKGFKKTACEIMGITTRSYSNYSDQKRPMIKLLEMYTSKNDLEEFLKTGKINKFEIMNDLYNSVIHDSYLRYNDIILNNSLDQCFNDFYFNLLLYIQTQNYERTNVIGEHSSFEEIMSEFIFEFKKTKQCEYQTPNLAFITSFDKNMIMFLKYCFKNDFYNLLDFNNPQNNTNIIHHIVSYNVYKYIPSFGITSKNVIIGMICDKDKVEDVNKFILDNVESFNYEYDDIKKEAILKLINIIDTIG